MSPRATLHCKRSPRPIRALVELDEAKATVGRILERYPEDSIAVYRVTYAHHARQEDLNHRLEPLRVAGLPEWPYGFEGDDEDQIRGDAIDALTFGRTWVGELAVTGVGPFMRYTDRDGSFVERGSENQSVGTATRDGDLLCLQTPGLFMGRRYCGPLYRNPNGTPEKQDEYSFVSASGIRRFTDQAMRPITRYCAVSRASTFAQFASALARHSSACSSNTCA